MQTCKLCVEIEYDPDATDPESLASMMDHLFKGLRCQLLHMILLVVGMTSTPGRLWLPPD